MSLVRKSTPLLLMETGRSKTRLVRLGLGLEQVQGLFLLPAWTVCASVWTTER